MNTEAIKLTEILPIENPGRYKLHLAARSAEDGSHPLDVYLYDRNNWIAWNEWRGNKNDWNRDFIFTLIEYSPIANAFLFGGVFAVDERLEDRYVVSEVESFAKWEGRLICKFHRYQGMRGRAFRLENFLDSFEVLQVLPQRYDGEQFCGHEWVNHAFTTLAPLFANQKQDWKASLSALKGVYLITDHATGKVYVGSAYGGEATRRCMSSARSS